MPLNELYRQLGISKQAVHQYQQRQHAFDQKMAGLIIEADELRAEHPGCGVEKMYYTLNPDFIGRDRFIETFMELGYRVKKIKNYHRTTIPSWLKYPNLIEGLVVSNTNMVWQSDITYFELGGRFYYIVFILDVYSRKIVGYAVSESLRAEANIRALKMALQDRQAPLVHHSDRGSQYIDKRYVKMLTDEGTRISMGLQAQDNAYAERVNGIIKNEYLKKKKLTTLSSLRSALKRAVEHYNNKRIHRSLPHWMTPVQFESIANTVTEVEIIYARECMTPVESAFNWSHEIKKNDLFCQILI
jgi:hypothetical protein